MTHTRIGEKGQLTIPKQYRDEFGLQNGAPIAVLRIGAGLMLIPEQTRLQALCESISSVLERHNVTPSDLIDGLPEARQRVYARRYPGLARQGKLR
jgi:AbrB family looped-hinge helix DNA binding protein